MKDSQSYKNAFLISLTYFVFGVFWISISDNIVAHIVTNREELTLLQNYKGWFFIVLTTILLYLLTYRFFKTGFLQYRKQMILQKEHEKHLIDSKQEQYLLAHQDRLTKLPNRLHMTEYLDDKYVENRPFSLILLGLDSFKVINDSYGHKFGDNLIIGVVKLLRNIFGKDSFIAHIGGDEFGIILDSNDKEHIEILLETLKQKFNTPFLIDTRDIYITASSGIAICDFTQKSLDDLLQQADSAMYNAKKTGKNTYCFYDEKFIQDALIHTNIVTNLKKALQNNELELYYQSQNDPFTNKIVGVEALLRWRSENVMISPALFIPIAEESGLIIEIGNLVLKQGCKAASFWHKKGILNGKVAINISPKQLSHPTFLNNLTDTIKETNCNPEWIELEITESSLMQNPEEAILLLQQIKKRGFSISIDDFGTGYSSLSYIKNLPIDKLKIDQSFIRDIKNDPKNQTIVKTTIALAKGLSIVVLAEGVETLDELDFLKTEKIDSVQGYYYTQPMPLKEMEGLLEKT